MTDKTHKGPPPRARLCQYQGCGVTAHWSCWEHNGTQFHLCGEHAAKVMAQMQKLKHERDNNG